MAEVYFNNMKLMFSGLAKIAIFILIGVALTYIISRRNRIRQYKRKNKFKYLDHKYNK